MRSLFMPFMFSRKQGNAAWVDTFVLGVSKPIGGTNVGEGIGNYSTPTETIEVGAGISFNADEDAYTISTTVQNKIIDGFVVLILTGKLTNCKVIGPAVENTTWERAMVEGPNTTGQAEIEFVTIEPQTPSAYYDGIGRGVKATRCWVRHVTDGCRAFSTSVNGVRLHCEGVHFGEAAQFAPDYVNSRDETHNDVGVGAQGNPNGDVNDLYFEGCAVNARHSTVVGDQPKYHEQISALMLTPAVGSIHMTFKDGWLEGGAYCVNAGSDTLTGSDELAITGNRFERPGTDAHGDGCAPTIALAVDDSLDIIESGNIYIDNGLPVSVTSA